MSKRFILVAGVLIGWGLLLMMCGGCNIAAPTPIGPIQGPLPTPPSTVATTISLHAVAGIGDIGPGASAGKVFVTAQVDNSNGQGIGGLRVTFFSPDGVWESNPVMTDPGGLAQTSLSTMVATTITAKAGGVSASLLVTPNP